jgi:glycosyltransferase involved in cell wall biosynthesis
MNKPKLAYISFDVVPAPKGAAVHIAAFVEALAHTFGDIQLVTVSPTTEAINKIGLKNSVRAIAHFALPALGTTLIDRVLYFRRELNNWLQGKHFDVIQIRSIYEGYAIAKNKQRYCDKLIFEVNGLPSIELKYRYPLVADDKELLHKLRAQEQICLEAADLIVTQSSVTAGYLQARGMAIEKIRVIPNGVDLSIFTYLSPQLIIQETEVFHLLYFGTLSSWQGVNIAVEALAAIAREFPVNLTVIGFGRLPSYQKLKKLALKLGVADKLILLEPISQQQLVKHIHAADAIVAPLMPNDRNVIQGCCPLKVLEAMATGTSAIASDLPVVRELGTDGVHLLLVKPGSAKAIKDAVLKLCDRELREKLAVAARQQIESHYTWQIAGMKLIEVYAELGLVAER